MNLGLIAEFSAAAAGRLPRQQERQGRPGELFRLGVVDQMPGRNSRAPGAWDPPGQFGNPVLGNGTSRAAADDERLSADPAEPLQP